MRYLLLLLFFGICSSHGMSATGRFGAVAGRMSGNGMKSCVFVGRGVAAPPARAEGEMLPTASRQIDTDGDGLADYADPDNDNDGLSDADELAIHHTDPNHSDSDRDGLGDGEEINQHHTNPNSDDSDSDGATDGWEIIYGFDPTEAADGEEDADGDGLSNRQEFDRGSDPGLYEVKIKTGWNLISLARIPNDNTPDDIFQGHINGIVWLWNEEILGYEEAGEILPLRGYWVHSEKDFHIYIILPNTVLIEISGEE